MDIIFLLESVWLQFLHKNPFKSLKKHPTCVYGILDRLVPIIIKTELQSEEKRVTEP